MGVSRRRFTKEFKLAAVRRLEQGVSIVEEARALEISPNIQLMPPPDTKFPSRFDQTPSRLNLVRQVLKLESLSKFPATVVGPPLALTFRAAADDLLGTTSRRLEGLLAIRAGAWWQTNSSEVVLNVNLQGN